MKYGHPETISNMTKIQLPQETIITKIITELQEILTAHYNLYKLNETLPAFQELFCINNALAKIHNGKLQLTLQYNLGEYCHAETRKKLRSL